MLLCALLALAQVPSSEPTSAPVDAAAPTQAAGMLSSDAAATQPTTAASADAEVPAPSASTPEDDVTARTQKTKAGAVAASVNPDQAQLSGDISKRWNVIASLGTSLGTGTFTRPEYFSYVGSSLGIEASYVFQLAEGYRLRANIRQGISWEYTAPDNPSGRRFLWSDTLLGASARIWNVPGADIDLWGSTRFVLPISLLSQRATLITAVIPGFGASRTFAWSAAGQRMTLNLRYDLVFRKNFHRFMTPSVPPGGTEDAPYALARSTDVLVGGGLARGNANTDMAVTNALSISYGPLDWLSVSVFFGIINTLSYPLVPERDGFTSQYASIGAGRSDLINTNLDITFTALPSLLISTGISTAAPPFKPDNRTLNNFLFATSQAPLNQTTLYLGIIALL